MPEWPHLDFCLYSCMVAGFIFMFVIRIWKVFIDVCIVLIFLCVCSEIGDLHYMPVFLIDLK